MQSRDIASDEFRGPRSVMFVTGMPEVNSWNDSADAPSLVNEITFAGRVGAAEQSTRDRSTAIIRKPSSWDNSVNCSLDGDLNCSLVESVL